MSDVATSADGPWPEYLIERALRAPAPGLGVVPGSTPVVAFGDPVRAQVATLGINPSSAEFLDRSGELLAGDRRRLATLPSLGVSTHEELTPDHAAAIVDDCASYFDRRPYHWFDVLDRIVAPALGTSYRDRSVCHLDLVQWATSPVWGQLDARAQAELGRRDLPFLRRQLAEGGYRVVIVNGRSVMAALASAGVVTWREAAVLDATPPTPPARVSVGRSGTTRFIGWTCNLQSQPGAVHHVERLVELVAELAGDRRGARPAAVPPGPAAVDVGPASAAPAEVPGGSDTGSVPRGLHFRSKPDLVAYLAAWLDRSSSDLIGDVGTYGGKVWVTVDSSAGRVNVNSDTKREAVEALVRTARSSPGGGWRVVANRAGRVNKVLFGRDATPGWYAYLAEPLLHEAEIGDPGGAVGVRPGGEPTAEVTTVRPPPARPAAEPATRPGSVASRSDSHVGTRTLAIVQFPHPGAEHVPPGRRMGWNRGNHARKFLVSPGRYVDAAGEQHEDELAFWGEWEPPSEVVQRWPARPGLPTAMHRPSWSTPADGGERQNTDPWVFGEAFLYSNCRQLTQRPYRAPTAMQGLASGSTILFGSTVGGDYVLDTVFVVGRVLGPYTPADHGRPAGGDEAFEVCTVDSLRTLAPEYAEASFTLYEAATPAEPVHGMYSFVPCRPSGSGTARFARPALRLPGIVNPRSTQAASGAGHARSVDEVVDAWLEVVTQVLADDLHLGTRFATPPRTG